MEHFFFFSFFSIFSKVGRFLTDENGLGSQKTFQLLSLCVNLLFCKKVWRTVWSVTKFLGVWQVSESATQLNYAYQVCQILSTADGLPLYRQLAMTLLIIKFALDTGSTHGFPLAVSDGHVAGGLSSVTYEAIITSCWVWLALYKICGEDSYKQRALFIYRFILYALDTVEGWVGQFSWLMGEGEWEGFMCDNAHHLWFSGNFSILRVNVVSLWSSAALFSGAAQPYSVVQCSLIQWCSASTTYCSRCGTQLGYCYVRCNDMSCDMVGISMNYAVCYPCQQQNDAQIQNQNEDEHGD